MAYAPDPDVDPADRPRPQTVFLRDGTKSILVKNESPDLPFAYSINPYRGCEHGCIYCYARPYHEYLGFSAGLDFETRIMVKADAPELLRAALSARTWTPQPIAVSGVTDAYQPIERSLRLTRRCLEVLLECRNPVAIVTKNRLVTRDIDVLAPLVELGAASVAVTVTTLDTGLNRIMEPRTSLPRQRLETIAELAAAGIPVHVMVAPVVPGLTDHEVPGIVAAAAEAGARSASYIPLRLPHGVAPLFEAWLAQHFPDRKDKVLNRIRAMRGGQLNDPRFGSRMRGEGIFADHLSSLFRIACRRAGFQRDIPPLETRHFRRPQHGQLELFD